MPVRELYMAQDHISRPCLNLTATTFVDNKCDDLDGSYGGAINSLYRYGQYRRCERQPFLEQLGEGWR